MTASLIATLPDAPVQVAAANRITPVAGAPLQVRVVDERRMAFRLAGSGPPLLLVHGIGDSSATWAPVLPALARRHLVIAPDLPGHGLSDPVDGGSAADHASALVHLLDLLDVRRAHVLGHSLGAMIAGDLAARHPERVDRLVLVGGTRATRTPAVRAMGLPGATAVLQLLQHPLRLPAGALALLVRALGAVDDLAGLLRVLDEQPDVPAAVTALRALIGGALPAPADVPTLLLWGDRDALVSLAHGRRAQSALPGSTLTVLPGAGHFPYRTDPQGFAAALTAFLPALHVAAPAAG